MYFNTSYVKVQHSQKQLYIYLQNNFNTSYVKVQLILCYIIINTALISIHPMLRFNQRTRAKKSLLCQISIHPMLRFNNTSV